MSIVSSTDVLYQLKFQLNINSNRNREIKLKERSGI